MYKNTTHQLLWLLCSIWVLLFSCTKFDNKLEISNNESGIIKLMKGGLIIDEAQIDETITLYAKIGGQSPSVRIFIADVAAEILSHGQTSNTLYTMGGLVNVPMDSFNVKVPKAAKIGPGTIYITVNEIVKPAMNFNIKRPDILLPNKITLEPFVLSYHDSTIIPPGPGVPDGAVTYSFPEVLRDGGPLEAVVNLTARMTYDPGSNTFYFLDYQRSDKKLLLRMIKNGMVTTIAGAGNDYFATKAANLRLSTEEYYGGAGSDNLLDLEPGPDGKLYFTNNFRIENDPVTNKEAVHALIQRIDPKTGIVELVAGGKRQTNNYPSSTSGNYRGFIDGHTDTAMLNVPRQLTFAKDGQLYFLDGWGDYYGGGAVLRRITKAGMVETVLGKINTSITPFVDEADGKTYQWIEYTAISEHSDGFGDEVRLYGATRMVQAGNGKFYILSGGAGWGYNIVEVNMDTKEASTILGLPEIMVPKFYTGTFKEVGIMHITALDVDFDGNLLYGYTSIYKMDLQTETVALLSNNVGGVLNKIVFDQFGNLYCGLDYIAFGPGEYVRSSKIIIER